MCIVTSCHIPGKINLWCFCAVPRYIIGKRWWYELFLPIMPLNLCMESLMPWPSPPPMPFPSVQKLKKKIRILQSLIGKLKFSEWHSAKVLLQLLKILQRESFSFRPLGYLLDSRYLFPYIVSGKDLKQIGVCCSLKWSHCRVVFSILQWIVSMVEHKYGNKFW